MTKKIINTGTAANSKNGDSLRTAFTKINENFGELYTALGLNVDGTLNLGAFEFAGSTMSTTDSTPIVIDQSVTVSSDLTIGGDLLPNIANGGDLGSLARPWKSLYVSNQTIYLGSVPLSLDANNNLTVNGSPVTGGGNTGTVWTNDANGCLRAELSSTGFQAFTDATHLDLQDSGQWTIGSYQYGTFIGNDEFTNVNILSLRSGDDTYITTNLRENGNHQWKFGTDGNLTFPNGSTIGASDPIFGVPITTTRGSIFLGNQAECAGGENHFHIMKAGQQEIDLFLGDDYNYVKLPSTGGVEISSSLTGDQFLWQFGGDGTTTFPDNKISQVPDSNLGIQTSKSLTTDRIIANGSEFNTDQNVNGFGVINGWSQRNAQQIEMNLFVAPAPIWALLTGLALGRTVIVTYSTGSGNQTFTSVLSQLFTATGQYDQSSRQRYSGRINGTLPVGQTGIVSINFPELSTQNSVWTFDADGNLTFPNGDITIGHDPYGSPAIIGAAGKSIAMIASGVGDGYEIGSSLIWVDSITEPTKIAGVAANNPLFAGAGDVGIVTGDYGPGGNVWNFSANGNLTIPGDIRSEGNINIDINLSDSTLRRWQFGEDGSLTLPSGGDILNSSGQSVLGGGSYTPDDSANWNDPTVNTVAAALNELAARVTALQNFEIDGGNAYTPAAGELIIDGNGA